MPFSHIQGAFREVLLADAAQCVDATGLTPGAAAVAEPLAVVLHATGRAGGLLGKRVLITGCGPIGALARNLGADRTINMGTDPDALAGYGTDKGHFDVLYECSGVAAALAGGIAALRPRGVILQLGLGGDMALPMMAITGKELDLRGAFRFHAEFAVGVRMMRQGLIDVAPPDHPHPAAGPGRGGVPSGRRPDAGDEGADRLRLNRPRPAWRKAVTVRSDRSAAG
jgi:L-idonate 5-dehydrogenase